MYNSLLYSIGSIGNQRRLYQTELKRTNTVFKLDAIGYNRACMKTTWKYPQYKTYLAAVVTLTTHRIIMVRNNTIPSHRLNEPSIIRWIIYLRYYTNTYRVNSTILCDYIYVYLESVIVFLLINAKQKVYTFCGVRQRLKIQSITQHVRHTDVTEHHTYLEPTYYINTYKSHVHVSYIVMTNNS